MDALMHASERTRLQLALLEGSSSGWSARGSLNSKLAASSSPARRRCRSGGASSGRFVSIRRSRSVSSHWQQCQVTQEGESNKALNLAPSLKVDGAAVRRHPLPAPRCYSRSRGASLDDAAAAAVSASGAADSSLGGVAGSIQDLALDGFGSHWTAQAHDVDHRAAPSARGIDVEERQEEEGLGIVSFLKGKHILVTGATGFVAKVLVEKILREQPGVGQLYLLIRPLSQKHKSSEQRLIDDVLNCSLFEVLREKHGESYVEFMRTKITAVPGNVSSPGLGIEQELARDVASKLDVIVHSAATTNFHEQYQTALQINTLGPSNVLGFGKRCPRLQAFVHLSTAFVNGTRQGLKPEAPFRMGDNLAGDVLGDSAPTLDSRKEIEDAYKMVEDMRHEDSETFARTMIDMGLQRANAYGWQDTYVFTKAMGEMLLNEQRGDIPVTIVRPSIVESTFSQPFPGWIEGHRMVDPLITFYGKGQLTGFLCAPDGILDVVPCDLVVNATLAAMAKHARRPGLSIYQVASSNQNPLFLKNFFGIVHDYFAKHPLLNVEATSQTRELKPFSFFPSLMLFKLFVKLTFALPLQVKLVMDNWADIPLSLVSEEKRARYLKRFGRIQKASEQYEQMAVVYRPYGFCSARFGDTNTLSLHSKLSPQEEADFGFDVKRIDWRYYLSNVHIPGLRQHVMKGRFDK